VFWAVKWVVWWFGCVGYERRMERGLYSEVRNEGKRKESDLKRVT
jgi:hypothetical protein